MNLYLLSRKIFPRRRKTAFPFADRLLADALRLAEFPQGKEEKRVSFVLDRLRILGQKSLIDNGGSALVRFEAVDQTLKPPPLLLFSSLRSKRLHVPEFLCRVDTAYAQGAGLADTLGPAALLSIAEGFVSGRLKSRRDVLLFFVMPPYDNPARRVFQAVTGDPALKPGAALGIRGFHLGNFTVGRSGICRIEINLSWKEDKPTGENAPSLVEPLLEAAHRLSSIAWGGRGHTMCHIRRLEAEPSFGIMEAELESPDRALLEMALHTVKSTVQYSLNDASLNIDFQLSSYLPPGNPGKNAGLLLAVEETMGKLRIVPEETYEVDPAAILSGQGIPALSLGIVSGREEVAGDIIEIASIDKGRRLLESLIQRLGSKD